MYRNPESYIGEIIDGHRIDAVLGKGGMGTVFAAENLELSRTVALKMINPALAQDDSFLRRFRLEARALAQLQHPNIVLVYTFRASEEGAYISMEHVEGVTLADYLEQNGPVPWQEALGLMRQMLSAFHVAHSAGVIHRDIKPRNILLNTNNQVKITDFGLAKVLHASEKGDTTVTAATGGTIYYMPPEQIRGLRNVDHRGDIFSLGMTMYETLTGALPFNKKASWYTIQKTIVEKPFPDVRKQNPDLPKPLSRVVMKALEKDPSKRFQSASEMMAAIDAIDAEMTMLSGSGPSLFPPFPAAPAAPMLSRQVKMYAALIAFLVLAGSAIAIFLPDKLSALVEGDKQDSPVLEDLEPIDPEPITPINSSDSTGFGLDDETIASVEDSVETQAPATSAPTSTPNTPSQQPPLTNRVITTGTLYIDSTPSLADVYIAGDLMGRTPLTLRSLPAGNTQIIVRREGYADYAGRTFIIPGEVTTVNAPLNALEGTLKLTINPGGRLTIDGDVILEEAPGSMDLELNVGSHTIEVEHPELGSWQKQVTISENQTTPLSFDFTETFSVTVTAFDENEEGVYAEIYLDGNPTGLYTPRPIRVPFGDHEIDVRAEGFSRIGDAVTRRFTQDANATIRFTMKAE